MATITARMTARKGIIADLPRLLPGELGLATDEITTTDLAYGITVTDSVTSTVTEILGANITFADQKATFTHPLKASDGVTTRVPVSADTFSLWYNKEIGYTAEAFVNPAQTLTFTASASATAQATGVEFLCENKDIDVVYSDCKTFVGNNINKLNK